MKKRILCILFLSIMIFSLFASIVSADDLDSQAFEHTDLSDTSIEYDFQYIFAGKHNVNSYSFSSVDKSFHFITSLETVNANSMTELYIYVYNPSRISIDVSSDLNKVNMSYYSALVEEYENTSDDTYKSEEYAKFPLYLIDTYGATKEQKNISNALIFKFKVEKELIYLPSHLELNFNRIYKIAEVELLKLDNISAESFIVGKKIEFFTKEGGYTFSSETDLATLDIDCMHTFYRFDTENSDVYEDVQSVFFPVPNEYLKLYGNLYSMNLEYDTYSYGPIIAVDDEAIKLAFDTYYINKVSNDKLYASDLTYSVLFGKWSYPWVDFMSDWWFGSINAEPLDDYSCGLWMAASEDYTTYSFSGIVELPLLYDVVAPFKSTHFAQAVLYSEFDLSPEGTAFYGEELLPFLDKLKELNAVHKDKTYKVDDVPMVQYKYNICNGWEAFWNCTYYNKKGESCVIEPFMNVDLADFDKLSKLAFSEKYFVNKNDVACDDGTCEECLRCFSKDEKFKDCSWYLLRYETTNYESYDAVVVNNQTGEYMSKDHNEDGNWCESYVFNIEAIRNFDVISLTFKSELEDDMAYAVFPVGNSPTNFVADSTMPSEKPTVELDDYWSKLKDSFDNFKLILSIITILLLVILILYIIKKFISIFRKENVINVHYDDKKNKKD